MSRSMGVELFGTMRVLIDGKPLPKMRSQKAKWLLALLALRAGKPIGRAVVASALWPDVDSATALTNLRSVLSDLRRALGGQAWRIQTPDRRTLAFDFQGVEIDVVAFDAAIQAHDLQGAIGLYTGPLLEDCQEEWVALERSSRERACLDACHKLAESFDPPKAIEICLRAIEWGPLADGPHRDLMTAYVRSGDVNAALATYRAFANTLRAETGGVPDPQTNDLYLRLRAGELPSKSEPLGYASLPHAYSSFIGREDERVELVQAIRSNRLVTLIGIGGIGKTRLAREVASDVRTECRDGVVFIALEAINSENALAQTVISALRIQQKPNFPLLKTLIETAKTKQLLLVLDNCEHIVPACAKLANLLLTECPEVRILATSREPLCLMGERAWPVPGLTTPDPRGLPEQPATLMRVLLSYEAVQLFVDRAEAASKDFDLAKANPSEVAELCSLLEGSPLAVELAAGRVRTMSVADILERFRQHRLDFLGGHRHVGAPRHQTLRAALDWSYSLLGEEERRLFARLTVFSDGWTLEAAEAVTDATSSLLESLVEKSLVKFSSNGRYGFLETVRQYGAEVLAASGEAAVIRDRHTAYYVGYAERLFDTLAKIETFEHDLANFNEAMDNEANDAETALRLALALSKYWRRTFSVSEGCRRIEAALEKAGPEATPLRAKILHRLAYLRAQEDRGLAITLHEEGLRIWRELGDARGTAQALHGLALAALYAGEYQRGETLTDECICLLQEGQDESLLALTLCLRSLLYLRPGDYVQAAAAADEALALMRKHAGNTEVAGVLRTIGNIAYEVADYDSFRRHNEQALAFFRSAGEQDGIAWSLGDLGRAATDLGETALGQDLLEQALVIIRKVDDHYGLASILEYVGMNAIVRGEITHARRALLEGLEVFRSLDHQFGVLRILDSLGDASRWEGNPDADSYYRESLAIWREVGYRKRIRDSLIRIGDGLSDVNRSIQIWACAHRFEEELGAPIPLLMRPRHEEALRIAQGSPGFEKCWATGWEMSLDEAVDLALTP